MDTSNNLFPHDHYVNAARRKKLTNQSPLLIWLSGLSGSGKSTIANELEKKLYENAPYWIVLTSGRFFVKYCMLGHSIITLNRFELRKG